MWSRITCFFLGHNWGDVRTIPSKRIWRTKKCQRCDLWLTVQLGEQVR